MPTVDQYRSDLDELVRLARVDLGALWNEVDQPAVARELLADVLPQIVTLYGTAAGTLAADWYDDLRQEEEVAGRFSAITAELPNRGRTDSLAEWSTLQLFSTTPNFAAAFTLVSGGLQRVISNVGRQTITRSSVADPQSTGWQRVGHGKGDCAFCKMLIGRGAVYREASVDFASHDHCKCTAAPAFAGKPKPVRPYKPSLRETTEADRARVRTFIRDNNL